MQGGGANFMVDQWSLAGVYLDEALAGSGERT